MCGCGMVCGCWVDWFYLMCWMWFGCIWLMVLGWVVRYLIRVLRFRLSIVWLCFWCIMDRFLLLLVMKLLVIMW